MKYCIDISLNFTFIFIAPNGLTNYIFISDFDINANISNDITETKENSMKSSITSFKFFSILYDFASTMDYNCEFSDIEVS
uniref:Uncharacterized protein n=1 Tax=Strongyloides venezuelensis TaxID=75913 RepID=A0A0K0G5A8_STRVS